MKSKKMLNQIKIKYLAFLFIFLFLAGLSSCKETVQRIDKTCSKTTYNDYKTYLKIPDNKIDYFSQVNIALILDTSGSMKGDKLNRAKEASEWLINELDPRINIALLEFNTNSTLVQDFTNDINKVKNALISLKAGGSTFFTPVLNLAGNIFENKAKNKSNDKINNIIILLSDGQPKDSYKKILSKVKDLSEDDKICIYTIGYTSSEDEESMELEKILKQISKLSIEKTNCGRFYSNVEEKSELVNVFKDIYTQIQTINYELFFNVEEKEKQIILYNQTLTYHFKIKSIYNLNSIPNQEKCIDPVPINVSLFKGNKKISDFNYDLEYNPKNKNYLLNIKNLSKGKYYLVLQTRIKNPSDSEKDIKAYKKIYFEVVNNPEYLKCSSYSCNDFLNAIEKSIAIVKKINISKCSNDFEVFNKPVKFIFQNKKNFTKYLVIENGKQIVSPILFPCSKNQTCSYEHFFSEGTYKIYCEGNADEISKLNKEIKRFNITRNIVGIDSSLSMSGRKIFQAKQIAKYLSSLFDSLQIFSFNEKTKLIGTEKNKDLKSQIDNIKLNGNTNLLLFLKNINSSISKKITKTNETNSTNSTPNIALTIISDGLIYDKENKIKSLAEELSKKGVCINTITYGNDSVMKSITNISIKNNGCGINYNKEEAYFKEWTPKKIYVKNYFENPFNITLKTNIDNSSYIFNKKVNVELEIIVHETNFSFSNNYFNLICPLKLSVSVEGYFNNDLAFSRDTEMLTDRHYFVKLALDKKQYKLKIFVNGLNAASKKCYNLKGAETFDLDLTDKLI